MAVNKNLIVPVPEDAYFDKGQGRFYVLTNAGSYTRRAIGIQVDAGNRKEMYPNDNYRALFPESYALHTNESDREPQLSAGCYAVVNTIANSLGLYKLMVEKLGPLHANAIIDFCMYSMIHQSNVVKNFEPSMRDHMLFSDKAMSDSWYSVLLGNKISRGQEQDFKDGWLGLCKEKGMKKVWLSIDGSNSDNSSKTPESEGGCAKSERKGQRIVSYMWAMDASTGMPVTYTFYRGSRIDSTEFTKMIDYLKAQEIEVEGVILDRGFCTDGCVRKAREKGIGFVVMLKKTTNGFKAMYQKYSEQLRANASYAMLGRPGMFAVSGKEKIFASDAEESYISLYFDVKKAGDGIYDLVKKVSETANDILNPPGEGRKSMAGSKYKEFLEIREKDGKTTVSVNETKLQDAMNMKGFSAIASSKDLGAEGTNDIYEVRQISEKGYETFKSELGNDVFRAHQKNGIMSRHMAGFIASIIRNEIERACLECRADTNKMIKEFELIRLVEDKQGHYIYPMDIPMKTWRVLGKIGLTDQDFSELAEEATKRCKGPGDPRRKPLEHRKSRRGRGRPKGSLNKKTILKMEQEAMRQSHAMA